MTFAQWLIDNKNGKSWNKYGKERVYINVYVKGMQIDNFFYDVKTDRFFGCEKNIERQLRNEFSANAPVSENEKITKLEKELETRQSMLRTQMRLNAAKEVIEENQNRIAEIKKELATEETATEETKKISTVDLQNFLSNKVSSEINAKVELKKIIKIIANKTQQTLQKEEVKEIATNKKISLVFQEQMLLLVFSRLEMTHKIHNLEDWTSNLLYCQDFDEMIKNIKDFIKEERGD